MTPSFTGTRTKTIVIWRTWIEQERNIFCNKLNMNKNELISLKKIFQITLSFFVEMWFCETPCFLNSDTTPQSEINKYLLELRNSSPVLPQTNITPLLMLLRNASTPLSLPPPLQTLANFGIPSTLSWSVSLLLFFLHYLLLNHCHRYLLLSSQTKISNCIPL